MRFNTPDERHSNNYRPVVRISLGTDAFDGVRGTTAVFSVSGWDEERVLIYCRRILWWTIHTEGCGGIIPSVLEVLVSN